MAVLVLLNANAGSIRHATDDAEKRVRSKFQARQVEAEIRLVKGDEIQQAAREFVLSKSGDRQQILVVGGGDGTVGSVASVVAGSDAVLGVLPFGTLNHFARDLRLPTDVEAAVDVIVAGREVAVDVAEVDGRVFLNNSSIGIYPFLVAERTAEERRWGMGKLLALGPALLRTLKISSWERVRLSIEGDQRELRTACVFVGNNFYDLAALGRRSSLTSAELCVYVVKRQSWWGLALLPLKIALGRTDARRDVELFRVQSLEIRTRRPRTLISMDGETVEMGVPLHYRIRPGALRVLAPAAPDGTAPPP